MEYRFLGKTGLKVSEICLGTMTFGFSTDQKEADRTVALALDNGVNFFDTANTYTNGQSETILGKALSERRREAVVATKFFNPIGPGVNDSGMSRVYIMATIEDSLRRLKTDYVDVYYVHHLDTEAEVGRLDLLVRGLLPSADQPG